MDYIYNTHTRTPGYWVGAIIFIAFFVFIFRQGVPWYMLAIVGFPMVLLCAGIVMKVESGLTISNLDLRWHEGKFSGQIWLREIETVEIVEWSDSTDVHILLKSGDRIKLPSSVFPRAAELIDAFHSRKISVTQR